MHDIDTSMSMGVEYRHERHIYPTADAQHTFEAARCRCRPRVRQNADGTHVYTHVVLYGSDTMGEHGANG